MPVFEKDHEASYKSCIQAARFRVKWKDIFNVKEFYRAMWEWSKEYGYVDMEFTDSNYYETSYFEKIGLFGDKELWLRWRWQKTPRNNNYYRWHIDLDFHFLYLVPTEVVRNGKKFKKNVYKGEMEVWITALLQPDYKREFARHPVLKWFSRQFRERIFRGEIYDEHTRELYREVYILQNFIKHWFKMKRYLPYEEVELFSQPSRAYPTHSGAEQ